MVRTFEERLTDAEKLEIAKWDKFLREDNKAYANGNRRDRYHQLKSFDENISIDGRQTDLYDIVASPELNPEDKLLVDEIIEYCEEALRQLSDVDRTIVLGKTAQKPMSSVKLAEITGLSDKTVTSHYHKAIELLRTILSEYYLD